jgi:hypothetical protein
MAGVVGLGKRAQPEPDGGSNDDPAPEMTPRHFCPISCETGKNLRENCDFGAKKGRNEGVGEALLISSLDASEGSTPEARMPLLSC